MDITSIKPYEKNAKIHDKKQIALLAKVIKEVGWRQNVEVNQQGVIVAGHGRWLVWQEHKKDLPPIWIVDDKGNTIHGEHATSELTPEQEKMWRIADNQINAMTGLDMKLAIEDMKELSIEMAELTGLDMDLLLEPDEMDDEVPEVPTEPQSKLGDIYVLGNHRVLCGDSTKLEDVEMLMDGKKADMFLSDPPYNVAYNDDSAENLKARRRRQDTLTVMNDKMDNDTFRQFLKDAFMCADVVLKPGGVFYIWHADGEGYNFRGACQDIGWVVRQCIIWNKQVMVMGRQDYHWKHEPCLYGWKDGAGHLWATDRKQTTVLNFDRPSKSLNHPTMKPVELIAYQLCNNTKGEDIILDLFLGSGTAVIASEKTGRICYGMELDPNYVDVIVERYCQFTGNKNIIKNGKEITWEAKINVEHQ
jgi:site-specific DNA-methyltransferase (adenine-specific)